MEINQTLKLNSIIEEISNLDSLAIKEGVSYHFLEFELNDSKSELYIKGNFEGLIYLSKVILKLAAQKKAGNHFHFDSTGIVDRCDIPVTICFKDAEWENEFNP